MTPRQHDWAADASDDDSKSTHSIPSEIEVEVDEFITDVRYRASFAEHPSTHSRTLYSISGNRLVDEEGNDLNIWTRRMQDSFNTKRLFHGHVAGRPGFGWFATSIAECKLIQEALETGYVSLPGGVLHVYPDEPGMVEKDFLGKRPRRRENPKTTE